MNHTHDENVGKPIEYFKFFSLVAGLILASFLIGIFDEEGQVITETWMRYFMGLFFITFAAFKIVNIDDFVNSFKLYDLGAKRFVGYGYIYPFIEFMLGVMYLCYALPEVAHGITIAVSFFSLLGVTQVLFLNKKVRCACLGNIIKLEVSVITFLENFGMGIMAMFMLLYFS